MRRIKEKLMDNKYFRSFLQNRYAVTVTFMVVISFVVLLSSHFLQIYRVKSYAAHIKEVNTRSLIVYLDGKEIGEVRNNEVFNDILDDIKSELGKKYDVDISLHNKISFENSHAEDEELTPEKSIYNKVKSNIHFGVMAYGINVDGKTLGVVKSKEIANQILEEIKAPYIKKIEREEADITDVNYLQKVSVVAIDEKFSSLSDPEELLKYLQKGTNEERVHVVDEGDSFWSIANDYNLTVEDLIVANPGMDAALIHPGDEISLIMPKPYIGVEVKAKVTYEDKIEYDTEYEYVSYMYNDEYSVKKKGKYGKAEVEAVVVEQNGIETAKEVLTEKVITEPTTKIVLQGTKVPPPKKGTGYFINPLACGTVTSRFGPRWGGYHRGLDIANDQGTPIKAADGGTVTFAGWYGNYGYMVEIDHGGGYKTRYAHCSKIKVSVGQKIYQGKTIALVGHTGYTVGTTGNHVHFEVRKYGDPVNPQSYIGTQYR